MGQMVGEERGAADDLKRASSRTLFRPIGGHRPEPTNYLHAFVRVCMCVGGMGVCVGGMGVCVRVLERKGREIGIRRFVPQWLI